MYRSQITNEFEKITFNPKDEELATHSSHYKPRKGRLPEKKRICALLSSLPSAFIPPLFSPSRKPKIALLNSFLDLG